MRWAQGKINDLLENVKVKDVKLEDFQRQVQTLEKSLGKKEKELDEYEIALSKTHDLLNKTQKMLARVQEELHETKRELIIKTSEASAAYSNAVQCNNYRNSLLIIKAACNNAHGSHPLQQQLRLVISNLKNACLAETNKWGI